MQRALGLRPPELVGGDIERPEGVAFATHFLACFGALLGHDRNVSPQSGERKALIFSCGSGRDAPLRRRLPVYRASMPVLHPWPPVWLGLTSAWRWPTRDRASS